MKNDMIITTNEFINNLLEEEEKTHRDVLDYGGTIERDELLYTRWVDVRTKQQYLVRTERNVHMGFNDSPTDKIEEVRRIVEKEGVCHASWGVTGRTMHSILAAQLAQKLPEYDFAIGSNYECRITKRS
jgi:hypothetical protein